MIKLYKHQNEMSQFWSKKKKCFNLSEAGTGKTIAMIDCFAKSKLPSKKMLILAPLSIIKSAWFNDVVKYNNNKLKPVCVVGKTKERLRLYNSTNYNIFICNHDFIKTLDNNKLSTDKFTHLVVDEFTAFKNKFTVRTKALLKLAKRIKNICLLSATPINKTVEELYAPCYLLDNGKRLGATISLFRNVYRKLTTFTGYVDFNDNADAKDMIKVAIKDITIKFRLDDCVDIPIQTTITHYIDADEMTTIARNTINKGFSNIVSKVSLKFEDYFGNNNVAVANKKTIVDSLNIASGSTRCVKELQVLAGTVYDANRERLVVSTQRAELIAQLVAERTHTIIAYKWHGVAESIATQLLAKKLDYAVIDSASSVSKRADIIDDFQLGKYKALLIQEQCGAHGITLTRANTLIWSSPTYNYETYKQMNARIKRISQSKKTTIIRIVTKNSEEERVYAMLDTKLVSTDCMLASL